MKNIMNVFKKHCFTKRIISNRKIAFTLLAVLLILGSGAVYYHYRAISNRNNSNLSSNQSLVQAKKELLRNPNDVKLTLKVAYLTKAKNPGQAKQYFIQALAELKKINNPDVSGKSAVTYWAAAVLAEQAGEVSHAKHYYEEVIKAAGKSSDSYDNNLAEQSRVALKRLI